MKKLPSIPSADTTASVVQREEGALAVSSVDISSLPSRSLLTAASPEILSLPNGSETRALLQESHGFVHSFIHSFVRQSTIDNPQSTIENQGSTIDNRQSTIDNRQSKVDDRQSKIDNRQSTWL
jgi:adhesin HecA-like repeat protein